MGNEPAIDHEVHDHEHTDIPVRTIGKYMLGLAISGVIIVLVLGGLWNLFRHSIPEEARVPAWQGPRELPPTPRLQIAPSADLAEYQREETERLNNYGWVDRPSGKVHIPINQAIDAIIRAGLPARKAPPSPAGDQQSNPESGNVSNETSPK
jgi:hypothetical protein